MRTCMYLLSYGNNITCNIVFNNSFCSVLMAVWIKTVNPPNTHQNHDFVNLPDGPCLVFQ